jgi:hypothetical protein
VQYYWTKDIVKTFIYYYIEKSRFPIFLQFRFRFKRIISLFDDSNNGKVSIYFLPINKMRRVENFGVNLLLETLNIEVRSGKNVIGNQYNFRFAQNV